MWLPGEAERRGSAAGRWARWGYHGGEWPLSLAQRLRAATSALSPCTRLSSSVSPARLSRFSGARGGPASRAWPRACHRVAPRSPLLATRGAGRRRVLCMRGVDTADTRQRRAPAHASGELCLAVHGLLTRSCCSVPIPRGAQTPPAGHLLSRTVRKWKDKVKLRGWPHKVRGPALRPRGAGAFTHIRMP